MRINVEKLKRAVKKFNGTLEQNPGGYAAHFYDATIDDCAIILRFPDSRFPEPLNYEKHIASCLERIRDTGL